MCKGLSIHFNPLLSDGETVPSHLSNRINAYPGIRFRIHQIGSDSSPEAVNGI